MGAPEKFSGDDRILQSTDDLFTFADRNILPKGRQLRISSQLCAPLNNKRNELELNKSKFARHIEHMLCVGTGCCRCANERRIDKVDLLELLNKHEQHKYC